MYYIHSEYSEHFSYASCNYNVNNSQTTFRSVLWTGMNCIRLSTLELTVLAWFACLSLFLFTAVPLLRFHSSDKTVVKSERCLLNSDTTLSTNTPITEDSNSWITAVMLKDDYLAIYSPKYVYYLITYKTAGLKTILASTVHLVVCGGWTSETEGNLSLKLKSRMECVLWKQYCHLEARSY